MHLRICLTSTFDWSTWTGILLVLMWYLIGPDLWKQTRCAPDHDWHSVARHAGGGDPSLTFAAFLEVSYFEESHQYHMMRYDLRTVIVCMNAHTVEYDMISIP